MFVRNNNQVFAKTELPRSILMPTQTTALVKIVIYVAFLLLFVFNQFKIGLFNRKMQHSYISDFGSKKQLRGYMLPKRRIQRRIAGDN